MIKFDDNGDIFLERTIDLNPIYEQIYEENKDVDAGWTKGRTMKKIATFDTRVLATDKDGIEFMNRPMGSVEEREAFDNLIRKFPRCQIRQKRRGR